MSLFQCDCCGRLPPTKKIKGKNDFGLDADYMTKNLQVLIRDIDRYTPAEMKRALKRLADAT